MHDERSSGLLRYAIVERVARAFQSHAIADKEDARQIARSLRAASHEPWLDEEEILVGESIPAAVERGLRDSGFVVLCPSAAVEPGWIEAERDARMTQTLGDRSLPMRLEYVVTLLGNPSSRRRDRVKSCSRGDS